MLNSLILLPAPRHLESRPGSYVVEANKRITLEGAPAQELLFTGQRLRTALQVHAQVEWTLAATASGPGDEIGAVLQIDNARITQAEGYELEITPTGIRIDAATPHGIFNAVSTLIQLLQQFGHRLPALRISDYPDFPNRGVMLDISRDKVPTMATLFDLVDRLASWKINQLQLYIEHTFSYRQHRGVWQDASPMTEQDILELDAFCRARFIELVPNQNSFGHLHRWLTLDDYRDLAEAPNGCDTDEWGRLNDPFSLNPTDPRCLEFLRGLYDELLPNFSSRQFNVGCDETMDLGKGRSRAEVERRGRGAVYLDFLKKIHAEATARGRRIQFWGDFILRFPELLRELPPNVTALEWGYEPDYPFDAHGALWAQASIPFYVCPGTSAWCSIVGRTDAAKANLLNAAENGIKHGAIGFLNTDWGDNGHWQYLPISYLGFAYGAALSWCLSANRNLELPRVLDLFAFQDAAHVMGRLADELGNAYLPIGPAYRSNYTSLQIVVLHSLEEIRQHEDGTPGRFQQIIEAVDRAMQPLAQVKMKRADAELIQSEFETAARLARHAARRGLLAFEADAGRAAALRRELDADMVEIMRAHERLWHARNRPGGFRESVARMEQAREAYKDPAP